MASSIDRAPVLNGNAFNPFGIPSAAGGRPLQLFGGGGSLNANAGNMNFVMPEGTSGEPCIHLNYACVFDCHTSVCTALRLRTFLNK